MQSDDQFLREVKADLRKDKILNFLATYKLHLFFIFIVLAVILGSYFSYNYYMQSKAEKNSINFYHAKELIEKKDNKQAIAILDNLIQEGTSGYQFISYLEKVKLFLKDNKIKEAVDTLKEAKKETTNIPAYYSDILLSIEFMIRMNSNMEDKTLLQDIKQSLNEKDTYYYFNLEMYSALLIKQGNYKEALIELHKISTADLAPQSLKDRASRIESLVVGYIGN